MKNTGFKIAILIAITGILVSSILIFMTTLVSPPKDIKTDEEVFSKDIKTEINDIGSDNLEESYYKIVDKINLYASEGMLSDKEENEIKLKFVETYANFFKSYCFSQFSKSEWNDKEVRDFIPQRVSDLKKIPNSYSELGDTTKSDLSSIMNVVNNYIDAWNCARKTGFVDDNYHTAISIIQQADRYRYTSYISNCSRLQNALQNVKSNLSYNHYNYIRTKVYEYYNQYNYDEYKDNYLRGLIANYNNNGSEVYGNNNIRDTEGLSNSLNSLRYIKELQ